MRWIGQRVDAEAPGVLPGMTRLPGLVRTVRPPEFAGVAFHEVLAKSALNRVAGSVPGTSFGWTINPYRGCSHACVYCFARPTHAYLEFEDPGAFDAEVVVKVNVAEVLRTELRRASWRGDLVALGTNTDPYQRAEGRYRLMPDVLRALADAATPITLLTKGTLLRRDLPLLAEIAERVPVDLAMSLAIFDQDLQQVVEPGTPSATARLATVRAARDAGLTCGVFLMPVLPHLTDSVAHLDAALEAIAASGASSVSWTTLRLKPGVKEWYLRWMQQHRPEHLEATTRLYSGGAAAPAGYRRWLAGRIEPLIDRHGLQRGDTDGTSGSAASRRAVPRRAVAGPPTLF